MRKTKRVLLDFLSMTMSVMESSPATARREEYYNNLEIYYHDLSGWCKKCTHDKNKDCFYKCKGFEDK